MIYELKYGDCIELMKQMDGKSVDMILCDLPYGTIACKWDKRIDIKELWNQYNRIITDNGIIALFGTEPFSTYLRMGNIDCYKYDWIWKKNRATGFQHAKNMPLKDYEIISIFSHGGMGHKSILKDKRMKYNPQGIISVKKTVKSNKNKFGNIVGVRPSQKEYFTQEFINYPKMVLEFDKPEKRLHPTEKPISLLEYLVLTYTDEEDIVLDNCMGSGSTGIACINTNRNFIGMELDNEYFEVAKKRIEEHCTQISIF